MITGVEDMRLKAFAFGLLDTVVKLSLIAIAVMYISRYAKVAYDYGYQIYNQKPAYPYDTSTMMITITEDMGVKEIAERLKSRGLIKDTTLFRLQERFSEYHYKMVPGTYELSPSQTPEEMIRIMSGQYEIEG